MTFKLYMLSILVLLGISPVLAQVGGSQMEDKIEARRIGHLTNELNLTAEEAKEFWPLYEGMKRELKAHKKEMKEVMKQSQDPESILDKQMKSDQDQLAIKHSYVHRFKTLIGAERTLRFLKAERGFNAQMLKGLRGKRAQKRRRSGL